MLVGTNIGDKRSTSKSIVSRSSSAAKSFMRSIAMKEDNLGLPFLPVNRDYSAT